MSASFVSPSGSFQPFLSIYSGCTKIRSIFNTFQTSKPFFSIASLILLLFFGPLFISLVKIHQQPKKTHPGNHHVIIQVSLGHPDFNQNTSMLDLHCPFFNAKKKKDLFTSSNQGTMVITPTFTTEKSVASRTGPSAPSMSLDSISGSGVPLLKYAWILKQVRSGNNIIKLRDSSPHRTFSVHTFTWWLPFLPFMIPLTLLCSDSYRGPPFRADRAAKTSKLQKSTSNTPTLSRMSFNGAQVT